MRTRAKTYRCAHKGCTKKFVGPDTLHHDLFRSDLPTGWTEGMIAGRRNLYCEEHGRASWMDLFEKLVDKEEE
jgi:hypothetical protein